MTNAGYAVGYGRPPQHTRFKKGQSGNPGGKPGPKKLLKHDFDRALCKALDADEKTFRQARPVRMVEIAARRTVIQALDGKLPALKLILSVLEKGHCDLSMEEEPLAAAVREESGRALVGDRYDALRTGYDTAIASGSDDALLALAEEFGACDSLSQGNSEEIGGVQPPPPSRADARATSPARGPLARDENQVTGPLAVEQSMSTDSLTQGNSQAISEKAVAADSDPDEAFNRLYEAARAEGRLDHLFDRSADDTDEAFEKRFNAACDAGLFDDFLALFDVPTNSPVQGNSQAIPQKNGLAQT